MRLPTLLKTVALLAACALAGAALAADVPPGYFDNSGQIDALAGGSRMIPITTPKGSFRVWTKRVGNNPRIKVLLLHGGPGMSDEYLEAFDSFFPGAGIQYYYYDQLGSFRSDQPEDDSLWTLPRFVDEVEQVRAALGLTPDNFYLFGNSWGGLLAMQYALDHPGKLKGLIIANMMSSAPAYDAYAKKVLMPAMDPKVLAEILAFEQAGKTDDPRYMELLVEHYYTRHILRMPPAEWPDPVNRAFAHVNERVYTLMQGPSEMGLSGRLEKWDVSARLGEIATPTLVIGAEHDTMDPKHMRWMAGQLPHGRYLHCPDGSHLAIYDDQDVFMRGIIDFIRDVDTGRFPAPENQEPALRATAMPEL